MGARRAGGGYRDVTHPGPEEACAARSALDASPRIGKLVLDVLSPAATVPEPA
jgi:hypothetical protein